MSSLWTPSGEHEPGHEGPPTGPGGPSAPPPPSAEEVEAIRRVHDALRATPASDVVANHAVQLFQLAAVYLGLAAPPDEQGRVPAPDLANAGVAIDALAALVEGLGSRFGEHEATLREALTQIQLAYVQLAEAENGPEGAPGRPSGEEPSG